MDQRNTGKTGTIVEQDQEILQTNEIKKDVFLSHCYCPERCNIEQITWQNTKQKSKEFERKVSPVRSSCYEINLQRKTKSRTFTKM